MMKRTANKTKVKRRNFSSFTLAEAYQQLKLAKLISWELTIEPVAPTPFFDQRMERLKRFDLRIYEESKKLLIDAICEEALENFKTLKIWKGASLEAEATGGYVDYLITEDRDYLEAPFLCVVEAKRDDFEQGLAQCLVEMQACQWRNQKIGRNITIFGIVTNGEGWKFYRLELTGQVYETVLYSLQDISILLGVLTFVFSQCDRNLQNQSILA